MYTCFFIIRFYLYEIHKYVDYRLYINEIIEKRAFHLIYIQYLTEVSTHLIFL